MRLECVFLLFSLFQIKQVHSILPTFFTMYLSRQEPVDMSILRGRVVLGDRMIESSSKWRDPFSVPKSVPDVEMIQSQKGRVGCIKRESAPEVGELTRHHSNKMRLTGIMDIGTAKLALIELPTGYIARAEVGQAIGLRHGKITQITANEVQIIEDQENKEECSTRIEIWLSLE